MFCPKCGSSVDNTASFCPICGASLRGTPQSVPQPSAPARESNTMAILGLVFAFLIPILGFIFSIIGLSKAKEIGGEGHGLAVGGLVVSIVEIVLSVVIAVAWFFIFLR